MLDLATSVTQVGKFALLGQSGRLGVVQGHMDFLNFFLLATAIQQEHDTSTWEGKCDLVTDGLLAVLFVQSLRPLLPSQLEKLLDVTCDLSWTAGAVLAFKREQSAEKGTSLAYALVETSLHVLPVPREIRMAAGVTAGIVKIWSM